MSRIEFLYCYLPTQAPLQEINWREEAEAAEECGFECHSFDVERFVDGDSGVFDELPSGDGRTLVYRGWLLNEEEYRTLEDEVESRGYRLHTNVHQYLHTTQLPNWYDRVADLTPPAVWTDDPDIEEAWELAQSLGAPPVDPSVFQGSKCHSDPSPIFYCTSHAITDYHPITTNHIFPILKNRLAFQFATRSDVSLSLSRNPKLLRFRSRTSLITSSESIML